ncbi:MAG: hypothetical protein DME15_14295 [Candidatus Rokuibacteriota bacterium]|nr:MAG: hypothetical protein DME15_14295 [Candidatus Rokubacteria bacterium]
MAQALAVRDGRIVEVGGTDEILWLREREYELVDLAGRCVIPGFVDPHNHFSIGALDTLWTDVTGAPSVESIQRALAGAARRAPAGLWVRARGYDHAALAGRRHPTRADLDAAVPEAGEPNGLLFERALSTAERKSREGWEARFVEVARAASLGYAAHGITAIQDAAVTPAMARRYADARAAGALAIRVEEAMVGEHGWFERPDDAAPGAWLKLFVDGGYRCAMRLPRDGHVRTSGFLFYEREQLAALLVAAWRGGRRVVCHAIGNLGVETAADAIEDALRREPAGRERVRVDHAMFLTRELIARLRDLGVWLVAQPSFLHDAGGVSPSPDLLLRPFASVLAAGARQAFSSDYPCGALAPLAGIHAAVTRRSRTGVLTDPHEAITPAQALLAYTLDAAQAAGMAAEVGSLEAGKRGDFVVLSANPLECAGEALASVEVLETWVGGERLHPAASGTKGANRPLP